MKICFNENNELSDAKRNKMKRTFDPKNLFLENCNYHVWFENEKASDTTGKIEKWKKKSADTTRKVDKNDP